MQKSRPVDPKQQLKYLYDKQSIQFDSETEALCPQVKILDNLIKYEQKIDQMMKLKRGELQEQYMQPSSTVKRTLRVIVYCEVMNDEWHLFIKGSGVKPLTHYFKQIEILLDKTYYPSQNTIIWNRDKNNQESYGIELKRKGPQSDITVVMHPLSQPQKYKVKKSLSQLIGLKEGTRSQILYCFWEYIKLNNLIDKENKDYLIADEQLKQLLGVERIPVSQITMQIRQFIEPQEPIIIRHNLTHNNIQGLDIIVDHELQYTPDLMPFLAQKVVTEENNQDKKKQEHPFIQLNQKIKGIEKSIQKFVDITKSHKIKRDHYLAYRKNPSIFLENMFIQQNAFLEMMNNEDEFRNDDPKNLKYLLKNQEIVERQIRRYIESQNQQTHQQQL